MSSLQLKDADFDGTKRNINKHEFCIVIPQWTDINVDDMEMVIDYTSLIAERTQPLLDAQWETTTAFGAEIAADEPGGVVMLKVAIPKKGEFEIQNSLMLGGTDEQKAALKKWLESLDGPDVLNAIAMRNSSDAAWTVDLESGKAERPKNVVSKAPAKKSASKKPSGAAAKKRVAKKAPAKKAAAKKAPAKKRATPAAKKAAAKRAASKTTAAKKTPAKASTSSYVQKARGARKRIAAKRSS